jgi:hypothetical protein
MNHVIKVPHITEVPSTQGIEDLIRSARFTNVTSFNLLSRIEIGNWERDLATYQTNTGSTPLDISLLARGSRSALIGKHVEVDMATGQTIDCLGESDSRSILFKDFFKVYFRNYSGVLFCQKVNEEDDTKSGLFVPLQNTGLVSVDVFVDVPVSK